MHMQRNLIMMIFSSWLKLAVTIAMVSGHVLSRLCVYSTNAVSGSRMESPFLRPFTSKVRCQKLLIYFCGSDSLPFTFSRSDVPFEMPWVCVESGALSTKGLMWSHLTVHKIFMSCCWDSSEKEESCYCFSNFCAFLVHFNLCHFIRDATRQICVPVVC